MKTIQFITNAVEQMQLLQIPAQIQIGSFNVHAKGNLHNWAGSLGQFYSAQVSFQLRFRPDHIQTLLDMGVKITLNECKSGVHGSGSKMYKEGRAAIKDGRYTPHFYMGDPNNAITGYYDNWLIAPATCGIHTLEQLDKFCRDNHRDELAIHNDTVLGMSGWKFKKKYPRGIAVESQYKYIKAIRRNAHGKPYSKLQPIEKRVLKTN